MFLGINMFWALLRLILARKMRHNARQSDNKYILLDVWLCSIAEYFYELCRILTSP